jgi:hypothetical protein
MPAPMPSSGMSCAARLISVRGWDDQPLGEALVKLGLDARGQIALIGKEQRRIDFEAIAREALDTEHGMIAPKRRQIAPNAQLQIEERRDGTAVERLDFGIVDGLAKAAFAFALEP